MLRRPSRFASPALSPHSAGYSKKCPLTGVKSRLIPGGHLSQAVSLQRSAETAQRSYRGHRERGFPQAVFFDGAE